jgi:predicted RNA polymerase sigma factor
MGREWKLVVGLLYGLTRDWYAAEDLAQKAFAAAERDWTRVGCMDRPGAWVRYRRNLWMSPWHEDAAYLPP